MDDRLTVALVVLVALGSAGSAVAVADGAMPVSTDPGPTTEGASANDSDESNGTAVGTEVSAFMESSSESANGSVDRGMFDAEFNGSNEADRPDLVRDRTTVLEGRLAELEAEKKALVENKENMSDAAYNARMSSVVTRIHELEAAINDTERKAIATGVDTDRLDRLRNDTGNLSGPEVSRIARNLSGVTPGPPAGAEAGNETGPPEDGGPPDDSDETDAGAPATDPDGSVNGTDGDSGSVDDGQAAAPDDTNDADGTNTTDGTSTGDGTDASGTDAADETADRTAPVALFGAALG